MRGFVDTSVRGKREYLDEISKPTLNSIKAKKATLFKKHKQIPINQPTTQNELGTSSIEIHLMYAYLVVDPI